MRSRAVVWRYSNSVSLFWKTKKHFRLVMLDARLRERMTAFCSQLAYAFNSNCMIEVVWPKVTKWLVADVIIIRHGCSLTLLCLVIGTRRTSNCTQLYGKNSIQFCFTRTNFTRTIFLIIRTTSLLFSGASWTQRNRGCCWSPWWSGKSPDTPPIMTDLNSTFWCKIEFIVSY